MNIKKPIRVLIVDDSELIRALLTQILTDDPDIEVVGSAVDPYDAREKIKQLSPDVLTLDIEMPRMDGVTFLGNLMRLRPMPVVMISTLTEQGADITIKALEIGAVDYVSKPTMAEQQQLPILAREIVDKVKRAATINVAALDKTIGRRQFSQAAKLAAGARLNNSVRLIAIGSSTGGTEALKKVLTALPASMPPIVIVQHMPPGFTTAFARRLDGIVDLNVMELTESGYLLEQGGVYLANGAEHLTVNRRGNKLYGYCDDGVAVNRHKPSVDVLFDSVADSCGGKAVAVILTGMGSDGAWGMLNIRSTGAVTIAQDEASSVVWGMPRVAVEREAATEVLALSDIGRRLTDLCYS